MYWYICTYASKIIYTIEIINSTARKLHIKKCMGKFIVHLKLHGESEISGNSGKWARMQRQPWKHSSSSL